MTTNKILIFLFLSIFSCFTTAIIAQPIIPAAPQPARYMVDMANMLTVEEAQSIEDKLYAYYQAQQAQIIVVTVVSLEGSSVEEYAEALFNKWGIGDKERKDGLLLLISKNDRKMRLEVGYGLEATLTDAFCAEVISVSLTPNFKNSDFYGGINAATKKIINKLSPNYDIPRTTTDSTRAAKIQNDALAWAAEQKQLEIKRLKDAAEASERTWLTLKFFFFVAVFLIFIFMIRQWLAQRKNQADILAGELNTSEKTLYALQELKQSEAYKDNDNVRDFVDGYYSELSSFIGNTSKQDANNIRQLRADRQKIFNGYQHFVECYRTACNVKNFTSDKYYPAEAQRVAAANKAQMAEFSHISAVSSDSNQAIRNKVAANLPQVKLSVHLDTQFNLLTACYSQAQKARYLVLPLVENFENSSHFQELIQNNTQDQAFLDQKAGIIRSFAEKIYNICLQCQNTITDINTIATTDKTSAQIKSALADIVTAQTNLILQRFERAKIITTIDYDIISSYLKDPELNNLIDDFPQTVYTKPFELLLENIKTFGTKENLTQKYSSTHTAVSITALTTGISTDTSKYASSFEDGNYVTAFQNLVKMFNGIFSTSAYLNLYLVAVVSRSYSSSSSSSSYTSSYSDYKPPYSDYSDYKPPYSDYSDYKDYSDYSDSYSDSSYGGGSSGGGGASGGW
jgi:uncharacterized membrane protein YgcG